MPNAHSKGSQVAKEAGLESKPKTFPQAAQRVWLETLNLLAEYGTLVVFSAGEVLAEALRSTVHSGAQNAAGVGRAGNVAILVAEIVTAVTMIAPKAVRAVGEILQITFITGHDVIYAFRHGSRRPRQAGDSGSQKRPGAEG